MDTAGHGLRRRKSAKERREQKQRSEVRHVGWVLKAMRSLDHRGSQPTSLLSELAGTLQAPQGDRRSHENWSVGANVFSFGASGYKAAAEVAYDAAIKAGKTPAEAKAAAAKAASAATYAAVEHRHCLAPPN